jgi:hypothetical protein
VGGRLELLAIGTHYRQHLGLPSPGRRDGDDILSMGRRRDAYLTALSRTSTFFHVGFCFRQRSRLASARARSAKTQV